MASRITNSTIDPMFADGLRMGGGERGNLPFGAALQRLARRIAGMTQGLQARLERRATINELHALSDRDLADIGLARADLPYVFSADFAARREAGRATARNGLCATPGQR